MTPKAKERLARLERRAKYLEGRIADDRLRGDSSKQHHYRRAEASALRWAVEHIRVLEQTVDRMPAEIAEWLTRNVVPDDEFDEFNSRVCTDCRGNPERAPPCKSCGGLGMVGYQGDRVLLEAGKQIPEVDWRGHMSALIRNVTGNPDEVDL